MLQIPFTVVFGNLQTISSCYALISNNCVGNDQYIDSSHSFMPSAHLRRKKALSMPCAWGHTLRIIFCYWGLGVEIDIKNFRHFTHIHVLWSMEDYLQEAGRAGRDDLPLCQ